MSLRTIKATNKTVVRRSHNLAVRADSSDSNTISIAISSETPYRRHYWELGGEYDEILGHDAENIDLRYMVEGAPFLLDHWTDASSQIGVLSNVRIDSDRVLRADVKFSNSARAQEILDDIKNGIRSRVSVGYSIEEYTVDDDAKTVRVTRWCPFESSLVSVPADLTVGVGRSRFKRDDLEQLQDQVEALEDALQVLKAELASETTDDEDKAEDDEETSTDTTDDTPSDDSTETTDDEETKDEDTEAEATEDEEVEKAEEDDEAAETDEVDDDAVEDEQNTTKALLTNSGTKSTQLGKATMKQLSPDTAKRLAELATEHNMTDKLPTWLAECRSVESVSAEILEAKSNTKSIGAPAIHTTKRDATLAGAVKSWLSGDNSEIAERGREQAKSANRSIDTNKLYIPTDMPMVSVDSFRSMYGKQALVRSSYGSNGSNATGKTFLTFEETLREGALLTQVGGTILFLNDVAQLPYFSTPTTANMYAETGSVSDTTTEIGLKSFDPKRIVARYNFSNLIGKLNGTYDFESILYNDLVAEGTRKFNQQVFGGTGANNISGIIYDTAIQSLNTSGSMSLTSASALRTIVAKNNANVDNGVFVLDHDVHTYVESQPSLGAGSGTTILDVIQKQNQSARTGYFPTSPAKCVLFGDFTKVYGIVYGPVEITRDNLTALGSGKTILNLEMFAAGGACQPGALSKWTNVTA